MKKSRLKTLVKRKRMGEKMKFLFKLRHDIRKAENSDDETTRESGKRKRLDMNLLMKAMRQEKKVIQEEKNEYKEEKKTRYKNYLLEKKIELTNEQVYAIMDDLGEEDKR